MSNIRKNHKRSVAVAVSTLALVGSLGFAGTYAYAEPVNNNVTVTSECQKYADEAKKQYAAYEEARDADDDEAAKMHYNAYLEAMDKYKKCQS